MKRYMYLAGSLAVAFAVTCACLHQGRREVAGEEPKKPVTIPKEKIYTTFDANSPNYLSFADKEPDSPTYHAFKASFQSGASNAFLVYGDDVLSAMKAARRVFGEGITGQEPAQPDSKLKSDRVWFGAFLGVTGSHMRWSVKSIEVEGRRIRLTYTDNKPRIINLDVHEYLILASVGKVSAGTYALELFDADLNEVTMMRKVNVK